MMATSRRVTNPLVLSSHSIRDINNVIIPHFEKYPLLSQKRSDFILFKSAVDIMNRREHLDMAGLHKILSIRSSMNNGLTEKLKSAFPDIIPANRPQVEITENLDPN
jgi:hypothetical protein